MSATTSAATGRCFGIQRVCQVWERSRSALYARRAGTPPPAGRGAGAAGAGAEAIGRAAAGGDSCRSRSVPEAKAIARSTPGFGSWTGSESPARGCCASMRAHGLRLPAPRASGRREDPRREGHHPGAQRDVGDGRRAGSPSRRSNTGTRSAWDGTCAKSGRFAALDPIAQGLERLYGSLDADVARGLALDGSR